MADRPPSGSFAQTLSRGLDVLQALGRSSAPMTVGQLAYQLGVHRSIVYRLVRTLVDRGFVETDTDGRYILGLELVRVAREVQNDLRTRAYAEMSFVADELGATVILAVVRGFELICAASVEPRESSLRITHREGLAIPMDRGASSAAILSTEPPVRGERLAVTEARARGWAESFAELEMDACAISVPVRDSRQPCRAAMTVLFPAPRRVPAEIVVPLLASAAERVGVARPIVQDAAAIRRIPAVGAD